MSTKKIVAILTGIALISFGIGLLSLRYNDNYKYSKHINGNGTINIDADGASVKIDKGGISIKDGENNVNIGIGGINIKDGNESISIGGKNNIFTINSRNLKSKTMDEVKIHNLNEIKSISAASNFVDIKFIPQNRNDVRVHYHGDVVANVIPTLKVEKNLDDLSIKLENPKTNSYTVSQSNLVLEIYVPNTFNGNYNVATASGEIEINNLEGIDFNITSNSGDIDIENIKGKTLALATSSGEIELDGLNFSDEVNLTSSSGDIDMDNLNSPILKTGTSSGNIKIGNFLGDSTITSNSGDIILDFKKTSGNIDIATSSGNIIFKLSNNVNYEIDGITSSGIFESDIPMTINENNDRTFKGKIGTGDKTIKIQTSSGDVTFTKN